MSRYIEDDVWQKALDGKFTNVAPMVRALKIDYQMGAMIMDKMECQGIVSRTNYVGKREWIGVSQ